MSAFGDKTLTQDILESLEWAVSEDKKEQLEHLHGWVLLIVDGEYEYLNDYIKEIAKEHNASVKDVQVSLGQIYNYFVEWWESPN